MSHRPMQLNSAAAPNIAVVHLVLRDYGLESFRTFVNSYRSHPAGLEHELLIAAKQFHDTEDFAPFQAELAGLPHRLLTVPDEGFDLGTYFSIAKETH